MNITDAINACKVRGYIARKSKPDRKFWKNTRYFMLILLALSIEDASADDWEIHDPDADEQPLAA